jgi:hypothetical protein
MARTLGMLARTLIPEGEKHRHLKALYLKGFIYGKPMTKMLVDGGATVNLMLYTTYLKLGKTQEDLIKIDMMLKDFSGNFSQARGVLNIELTIGSKTLPTTFFVIDGKGSYSLLLRCDWIHANCCVPSTMHQCLIQWQGDEIEVVSVDTTASVATADPPAWEFDGIECLSGKAWEGEFLLMFDLGLKLIQAIGLDSLF